ncbi:hypothetical protein LTR49_028614, partial [Elasticomyces elasticus]
RNMKREFSVMLAGEPHGDRAHAENQEAEIRRVSGGFKFCEDDTDGARVLP